MAQTGLLGLDEADPTTAPDYLGQPVPLSPSSQPALPVTGGPAVGAGAGPVAPGSAGARAAPVTAGAGGPQLGSVSPSALKLALAGGVKLSDLAGKLFPGTPGLEGGAVQTPSGQLTTSAPEILRPTQFPELGSALTPAQADLYALAEYGPTGAETAGLADLLGGLDAVPFLGAFADIGLTAAAGRLPPEKQGVNAALDVAAAALAPETLGLSVVALPFAKDQAGSLINLLEGQGESWKNILGLTPGFSELNTIAKWFGGDLTSLFEHEGPYVKKREGAASEAGADVTALGQAFQDAATSYLQSGDTGSILTALQTQFGERTPVRSWLKLPNEIALEVMGGPTQYQGNYGDATQVEWSGMNPEQFGRLLAALRANPDLLTTAVQGSGDVAYLPQAQAQQVADVAAEQSRQFLQFALDNMDRPPSQAPAMAVAPEGESGGTGAASVTSGRAAGGGGMTQDLETIYG